MPVTAEHSQASLITAPLTADLLLSLKTSESRLAAVASPTWTVIKDLVRLLK
ncbi:hypothetical protein PAMP_000055 [Pampus punctatissimus]